MTIALQTGLSPTVGKRHIQWSALILKGYLALFFLYLFVPLIIMAAAAFNSNDVPSITDWQGFTLDWFTGRYNDQGELVVRGLPQDTRLLQGLWNSLLIAFGVILISLPLGLSGALILTRLESGANKFLYALLVSPVLTPGIVLGITTMIFWRDYFDVEAGLLTAMLAQSGFIAAYAMLMFMARLQRQDLVLEEAALDLGASPLFMFRRVTLPFLMPTILNASAIAFLQSIENYNTTFFAIGANWTLVTEIGARMRFGISPVINVIGLIFVVLSIIIAILYVSAKQREKRNKLKR